jgi:heme-degrading monooxygenase HmoA
VNVTDRAQHVVLFKFPQPLSPEDEKEMFRRVRAWPDAIPGFTGLRIGKDVGGRTQGFDYLLLTEFESEEAHQAYYPQPDHQAFAKWVGERGAEVIRVDYPLTSESLVI